MKVWAADDQTDFDKGHPGLISLELRLVIVDYEGREQKS